MNIREQVELREKETLSPYASLAVNTRGRKESIDPCIMRTDYQRDRDRILHCNSFRRLTHKTQVFLSPTGDHYRTRLTHTLEVAQVARSISRALRLNEDLTEAIALGHDLGHTPFGHAGEEVLNELSPHGFEHSAQSVRIVEHLENQGKGLNLTWEVRNGIACHSYGGTPASTLEGQVVCYGDKIAYMNHDIDDAMRAGLLFPDDIPLEVRHELGRTKSERLTAMISDLVENSNEGKIKMSERGQYLFDLLRSFMFEAVYTNPLAKSEEGKAKDVIRQLYHFYYNNPELLPENYRNDNLDIHTNVCDYISGMSDRFCVAVYEDIFVPRPWGI